MKYLISLFLLFVIILADSYGQTAKTGNPVSPSVYIVGSEVTKGNSKARAVYWKDGIKTLLTDGSNNADATSITVVNKDIYISGNEFNGKGNGACYWKNGKKIELESGVLNSQALSITLSGNDIYVGGHIDGEDCYWKNGKVKLLTDGKNGEEVEVNSFAVLGSDVYEVGCRSNKGHIVACYWKNGKLHYLNHKGQYGSTANRIVISGSDIYIVGYYALPDDGYQACYWKNGKIAYIWNEKQKIDVQLFAVKGSDIFVAGSISNGITELAKVWKNKKELTFEYEPFRNNENYTSLFIYNNDIYVAGVEENEGKTSVCFWKNGKKTIIEDNVHHAGISFILVR